MLVGIPYSSPTSHDGVQVVASATGFESAILELPDGGSVETDTVWNPTLAPCREIAGHVLDERGVGLQDWRVRLHNLESEQHIRQNQSSLHLWTEDVRTDPDGAFLLLRAPDSVMHVSVRPPGGPVYARPAIVARDVAAGTDDLVLRVTDEARATGTVRGRFVCDAGGEALEVQLHVRELEASFGAYVAVAEDGRFELAHSPPGRYELKFIVAQVANVARVEVAVEANEVVDLGDVRVPDAGRVRIALAGPDTPLRGTLAWRFRSLATGPGWYGPRGAPPETLTLPGGDYELQLEASHYFSAPVRFHVVPNGETSVEVKLEPATLATFRFVAADGAALVYPRQVVVLDLNTGHELARREVASEGPLVLDIEPVACRLEATDAGGRHGGLGGWFTGNFQRPGTVLDVALRK